MRALVSSPTEWFLNSLLEPTVALALQQPLGVDRWVIHDTVAA